MPHAVEMMWRGLFRDILEPVTPPSELGKRERRRYYVAYGCWFILMMVGLSAGLIASLFTAFSAINGVEALSGGIRAVLQAMSDPEYSRENEAIWIPLMIGFGSVGFVAGNIFWYLLFIKSGYLSHAAAQRLKDNRAPTERGERIRVAIGYVTYLLISFGFGIPMVIYGEGTPLHIFTAIGLNGMGVFIAVHAFLRYRRTRGKGDASL